MIFYKIWCQQSKSGLHEWQMDGWYLFGFIPLFKRDLGVRGRFGRRSCY